MRWAAGICIAAALAIPVTTAADHPDDVYWDPDFGNPGADNRVYEILIDSANVYFGGGFSNIGGISALGVARWDGEQWHAVGTGPGVVTKMHVHDGAIYAAADWVYRWNGAQWSTVLTFSDITFSPAVTDMETFQGNLWVSGGFTRMGGAELDGLVYWDGSQWHDPPGTLECWYPYRRASVWGLATDDDYLYVVGDFVAIDGMPPEYVARWDGSEWSSIDNSVRDWARTAVMHDNLLCIAGWYRAIPVWDGDTWGSLGMPNGEVLDAYSVDGRLYLMGNFTEINNRSMHGVAWFSDGRWMPLGSGVEMRGWNFAVAAREDGEVFVGGDFHEAGGVPSFHVARWYNPLQYPSRPTPFHGATNVLTDATLGWETTGPPGTPDSYDVYLGTVVPPPLLAAGVTTPSYGPLALDNATTYYWKVVAKDALGNHATSTLWQLSTEDLVTSKLVVVSDSSYCGLVTTDTVRIDVMLEDAPVLGACGFDLEYDPTKLAFLACEPGSIAADWDVFKCADRGSFLRVGGYTLSAVPAGTYAKLATLVFLSQCCGIDSTETTPLTLVNLTDDFATMRPISGSFHCDIYEGNGDTNSDGLVSSGDALCTFESYFTFPDPTMEFCGEVGWDVRSDVNCSATISPGDARCIYAHWQDGTCAFCEDIVSGVLPSSHAAAPDVRVQSFFRDDDDVVLVLGVGNLSEFAAFGFDVWYPPNRMSFLAAVGTDFTADFEELAGVEVSPGHARAGGFADEPVAPVAVTGVVELHFRRTAPLSGVLTIDAYVDDLGGASTITKDLGVLEGDKREERHILFQNVPNPGNPVTAIRYRVRDGVTQTPVRLTIYSVRGALVARLVDEPQGSGTYTTFWDGHNRDGRRVASGVYFYALEVDGERFTRKLVIVR